MCAHTGRARCLATFAAGPTTRSNRVLWRKNTPALPQNSVVLRVDYHMIVCDLNFCLQIRGEGPAATTTCWVTRSRRHRHHHLRFNWFKSVQWGRFYPVESAKKLHNTDSTHVLLVAVNFPHLTPSPSAPCRLLPPPSPLYQPEYRTRSPENTNGGGKFECYYSIIIDRIHTDIQTD